MTSGILAVETGPPLCPVCATPMVLSEDVVCPCCGGSHVYYCPWCHQDPTTHAGATSPHDQDQEGERHEND